jgi:hypothetical protein
MHKFYGGRGRTRTGTPVSQKQILSLLTHHPSKFLCGHGVRFWIAKTQALHGEVD